MGAAAEDDGGIPDEGDIFAILQTLPSESLDRLYGGAGAGEASLRAAPWTCRAVLQSLSPLAKQYVMRLVCIEGMTSSAVTVGCVACATLEASTFLAASYVHHCRHDEYMAVLKPRVRSTSSGMSHRQTATMQLKDMAWSTDLFTLLAGSSNCVSCIVTGRLSS
eukprot:TRINITY_DN560_c0_g1_i4.p1 TRINITY_DN560_c0_g1~~TRINITY_DN560_c0_g1_i4.p1  ORF type:complete len:164 (-),score=4.97 TRINITY_DN560_c0_g1_i4:160-651(-)